jgi:hypothetical protein
MAADESLLQDLRNVVKLLQRPTPAYQPKVYGPANNADVTAAESQLGYRLPTLLRRIYLEVADGGFGPGHGLFPLVRGRDQPGQEESLMAVRRKLAVDPRWVAELMPICDWGCATWSCLDCRTEDGPIVTVAGEHPFTNTGHDLRSWLRAWLAGADLMNEMFEPGPTRMSINPFTKQPMEMKGQGKPRGRAWP